ncbi:DUF763 domain-containing protein [Spirochaeta thermophila]|nr:DUF763 domain-containing protein [Spirochaeta thermophila]
MRKTGSADLPLHSGHVPAWLAERMRRLSGPLAELILLEFGEEGFLSRLADPLWFQGFGALLGMDWHSSGVTTSVLYALKRALDERPELGIEVCGGRGRFSRKTPEQLLAFAERTGLEGEALVKTSRLVAKVDNTCVQDGYQLYLHAFVVTRSGKWVVIQQGMNPQERTARRYHWYSQKVSDFFADPHTAVVGPHRGRIINLAASGAAPAREGILDFVAQPLKTQLGELARAVDCVRMPSRHHVAPLDVDPVRLGAVLAVAHEASLREFSEFLLLKGMGPRTLQALALVAEVIYGAPVRFTDPARFSFAHGGKDGHPFPVLTGVYDRVIEELDLLVGRMKADRSEKRASLQKLHAFTRWVEETFQPKADVSAVMEHERVNAPLHGGRSVGEGRGRKDLRGESSTSPLQFELPF